MRVYKQSRATSVVMPVDINGMDELEEDIEQVQAEGEEAAAEIEGELEITELLTDGFVAEHTQFSTLREMLEEAAAYQAVN